MLTLTESWILFWKRLFSITGRSSRSEYWWMALLLYMVGWGLQLTVQFYVMAFYDTYAYSSEYDFLDMLPLLLLLGALILVAVVCFILTICLNVRRLHDRNLSGWWYLLALIPIVGSIFMFVVSVLPSVHYTTRFGADPTANPPAHFDFYSKKLHLCFGAFGLHPDMPGYPQYPDYAQYLLQQQRMQEEWRRQQKSTAQFTANQDYAFDPNSSQNQNNFYLNQDQNLSSYAFDPSASQGQNNLSPNINQNAFNPNLSQVDNQSAFNPNLSQADNQSAFNPNLSQVNNQPYQNYTGNANLQFNASAQSATPNQYGLNSNQAIFNQAQFQQPNPFSNGMFPNAQLPSDQFPNTPFPHNQFANGQFPQGQFNGQGTTNQFPTVHPQGQGVTNQNPYPFAAGQFGAQGQVNPFSNTQIQANQFANAQGVANQFANTQGPFNNVQGPMNAFPNYQNQGQDFASRGFTAQASPFFNGQFPNSPAHLSNDTASINGASNSINMSDHSAEQSYGFTPNNSPDLPTPKTCNPEFNLRTGFDEPVNSNLNPTELKSNNEQQINTQPNTQKLFASSEHSESNKGESTSSPSSKS